VTGPPSTGVPQRGIWLDAACNGQTALMTMPLSGSGGRVAKAHIAQAKSLCHACPHAVECLSWALDESNPATGMIAGGMTPSERRALR